ncbi:SH3 domain-containing protein [Leisingera daeponensis]|uniref:SH3 domain-containing protein n=1 Tax=Leisingera daeponensis TaxID=405746 RepID=UPI0021BDA286|nr:SH3 domain-containing protein [Leisingera daeponensis]
MNVRSGPGTASSITGALANGDQVRNVGCRDFGSAHWCQIEMFTDMRQRGWVNSRYLTKAAGTQQPDAGGTVTVRVTFEPGTSGTNVTDILKPGASRRYVLGARAGQQFYFRLDANGPDMSYQIFNPDKSFLLGQIAAAQEYHGQLWQSGDHVVEVINRGSGTRSYQAFISIE